MSTNRKGIAGYILSFIALIVMSLVLATILIEFLFLDGIQLHVIGYLLFIAFSILTGYAFSNVNNFKNGDGKKYKVHAGTLTIVASFLSIIGIVAGVLILVSKQRDIGWEELEKRRDVNTTSGFGIDLPETRELTRIRRESKTENLTRLQELEIEVGSELSKLESTYEKMKLGHFPKPEIEKIQLVIKSVEKDLKLIKDKIIKLDDSNWINKSDDKV